MDAQFNPDILTKFAGRLLLRATTIVLMYGIAGVIIAGAAYYTLAAMGKDDAGFFVAALALCLSFVAGSERAVALKIQAHTVLCQVQIEANTRLAARIAGEAMRPGVSRAT